MLLNDHSQRLEFITLFAWVSRHLRCASAVPQFMSIPPPPLPTQCHLICMSAARASFDLSVSAGSYNSVVVDRFKNPFSITQTVYEFFHDSSSFCCF